MSDFQRALNYGYVISEQYTGYHKNGKRYTVYQILKIIHAFELNSRRFFIAAESEKDAVRYSVIVFETAGGGIGYQDTKNCYLEPYKLSLREEKTVRRGNRLNWITVYD